MESEDILLETGNKTAGIELRPFTFGTLQLCRKLGLDIFTGEREASETDDGDFDADSLNQIQTFIWMQSQPVKHVLRAVKSGTWEDDVLEFSFGLELADMNDIMSSINEIGDVASTAVDVVEKPEREGDKGEGTPPPNL